MALGRTSSILMSWGWLGISSTASLSSDHISNDSIIGQEQGATNQAGML